MLSNEAEHARLKYRGDVASGYDAKRETQSKWLAENLIMESMLAHFPKGTRVLDIPIGSGRFIPLYEKLGFSVLGLDINKDMLDVAARKVTGDSVTLREGNVLSIDLPNQICDVAICIRMFRWLSPEDVQIALRELQRVSRKWIIFNARVRNHPFARPMSLLKAAIHPNWHFADEKEIEPDYMMFKLEKA